MEMVEAIIDNNYDVNSPKLNQQDPNVLQNSSARDVESNFEATSTTTMKLRVPLKAQLSEKTNNGRINNITDNTRRRKIHRQSMILIM